MHTPHDSESFQKKWERQRRTLYRLQKWERGLCSLTRSTKGALNNDETATYVFTKHSSTKDLFTRVTNKLFGDIVHRLLEPQDITRDVFHHLFNISTFNEPVKRFAGNNSKEPAQGKQSTNKVRIRRHRPAGKKSHRPRWLAIVPYIVGRPGSITQIKNVHNFF